MVYQPPSILFQIGNFTIYSWGTIVALGVLITLFLILRKAKKQKISKEHIYNTFISIFIGAIIFARLFYVLANLSEFNLFDIFAIWKGGLFGIGTITGGLLGMFFYTKMAKLNFLYIADIFVLYIPLTFAIGRIGCFLRGCCFGLPTTMPWGIVYSQNSLAGAVGLAGIPLHPTQIYHAIANITIFIILLNINKINTKIKTKGYRLRHGLTFFLFFVLFSSQRFLIDFVRYSPPHYHIFGLTIFQISYAMLFIIFFISLLLIFKKSNKDYKNKEE